MAKEKLSRSEVEEFIERLRTQLGVVLEERRQLRNTMEFLQIRGSLLDAQANATAKAIDAAKAMLDDASPGLGEVTDEC